jgi:hypothetical protein
MSSAIVITPNILAKAWQQFPTQGIQAIAKALGVRYGRPRRAMMADDPGRYAASVERKRQAAGKVNARRRVVAAPTRKRQKRRKPLTMVGWDDRAEGDPVLAELRAECRAKMRGMGEFSKEELAELREKVRGWVHT